MLLPEPHWRKSSEVDTSRMRFLQPQRLVLWVCSKASAFWFVAAAYERRCVSESGCITAWCVIVLFFGLQDDLNLSGYRKYLTSQAAPLPLTAAEEELRQIKLSEVQTHTHTDTLFRCHFHFEIILEMIYLTLLVHTDTAAFLGTCVASLCSEVGAD